MKLFFLDNDSFYKIYKTLEKLPEHKQVTCFVEAQNPMFDNVWWGKQIRDLIDDKKLQTTRIAKTEKAKQFFEAAGLPYEYKYKNQRERNLHLTYLFLFKNKTFQQSRINKADYIKYVIRAMEMLFFGLILYGIYLFVWPSARLTITPTYTLQDIVYNFRYYPKQTDIFSIEQDRLSIPYQLGSIDHIITMKQSVTNLSNAQQKASGTVTLYNTTDVPYDIIANSTFVTDNGLLFKAPSKFSIPPKVSDQTPGQITLDLVAADSDISGNIMGEQGNIPADTTLYIKNLTNSYFLKSIYAKANRDFAGGKTLSSGSVTPDDIAALRQKLIDQASVQMKDIIRQQFDIPDTVLLSFDKLFSVETHEFESVQQPGDESSIVQGSIKVTYTFPYTMQSDIVRQFEQYITDRSSDVEKLVDINMQSLTLYDIKETGTGSTANHIIIPTQVTTIQTYNFDKDPNQILPTLKENIIGKNENDAQTIINDYSIINNATIDINPFWLDQIPTTKSRIFFTIK